MYNNIASLASKDLMLGNAGVINNATNVVNETGFQNNANVFSDYFIEDASFLKLDNLTLGYTMDKIGKNSKLRIYTSVQNVFTFTKYTGLDPEVSSGIDYQIYPRARTLALGLNLNF